MPPPGWYPDPEQAWTWRWWDGSRWSELRAPQTGWTQHRDPYSFSAWFSDSVKAVKAVALRVGWMIGLVWLACGVLLAAFVLAVFNSGKGREIRSLLQFDQTFGSNRTVELTDAEFDRLGELWWDIVRAAIPWMIALSVVLIIAWIWTTVVTARVAARVDEGSVDEVSHADDAADAVRRVPAVFVTVVALSAIWVGVVLAAFVPMLILLGLDAGGVAVAVAAVFGFLAAVVLSGWLLGRLSLAILIASIGGWGLGLRRSWNLTDGHFWSVVGRLLIAGLIASAVTAPLSFVNSVALSFGFITWLLFVLLVQVLSNVITALVTIPAQVVIVEHLDARRVELIA